MTVLVPRTVTNPELSHYYRPDNAFRTVRTVLPGTIGRLDARLIRDRTVQGNAPNRRLQSANFSLRAPTASYDSRPRLGELPC